MFWKTQATLIESNSGELDSICEELDQLSLDTVCEEIDQLLLRKIQLLDEYIKNCTTQETFMKTGHLLLAKARYHSGFTLDFKNVLALVQPNITDENAALKSATQVVVGEFQDLKLGATNVPVYKR